MSKREEMQKIIASGGSVLHRGVLYSSNNPLPSEAELAKGDAAAEEAARTYIKEQIAYYQAQLELLKGSEAPVAKAEAPAVAPKVEEAKVETKAFSKKEKKAAFED